MNSDWISTYPSHTSLITADRGFFCTGIKGKKNGSNSRSDGRTCWPPQQKPTAAALAAYSPPPRREHARDQPAPYRRHPRWLQTLFTEQREIRGLPNTLRTMWPAAARSSSKREPDGGAGPTLRHPAISGQRGGRPVKMSTGRAVNPGGCSVISGGPGVFSGGGGCA